jgi:hypothetical protein
VCSAVDEGGFLRERIDVNQRHRLLAVPVLGLLSAIVGAPACHSDDHGVAAKTASAAAVVGAQDSHCGANVVTVDPAVCKQAAAEADAGADAGSGTSDYGPTMSNGEGDDDDCKYHLKWATGGTTTTTKTLSLHPLHGDEPHATGDGADVTFTVTMTNKKDGSPLTGAPVDIEAFLDETHPALNSVQVSTEVSPGNYTVGPVRFDVSGKWTVRFHIHDECNDSETSPHGHAAFFAQIQVQ